MLVNEIERQERMAQVVKNAHEEHHIKPLVEASNIEDGELSKLDVMSCHLRGKARLSQIHIIKIDPDDPAGAALLHLDGIEASVAADIEHRLAGQILWNCVGEALPFDGGIIAEEM